MEASSSYYEILQNYVQIPEREYEQLKRNSVTLQSLLLYIGEGRLKRKGGDKGLEEIIEYGTSKEATES